MPRTRTKTTDNKGRVALGPKFANRAVIIEPIDEVEVRIILARVIPEREAWLYENGRAKQQVLTGIEQAKAGRFSDSPPDIDADADFADEVEDG